MHFECFFIRPALLPFGLVVLDIVPRAHAVSFFCQAFVLAGEKAKRQAVKGFGGFGGHDKEAFIMKRMNHDLCCRAALAFNASHPAPSGAVFRLADVADVDSIMEIGNACYASDQPERHKIRHFVTGAHAAIFLLSLEGKDAGYVHLEAHSGRGNIYLNTTAVLPAYRGKGLGALLYDLTSYVARKAEASSVWCHVETGNEAGIYLLKKHGYIIERTEDPYYDDGKGAYVMRKKMKT
ncbi:MAG: hypothetical protein DI551_05475 [Micavibrio aeruginosavorus]|uniref:N-acetyltransferase domain-containing protein n=1 Tax=Micavibrio aeruginosavorus TaxID=349221 RepID=A0A2W5MZN8_9BACT|nr:MAG: hypothetical protein DI551_05475 [Micavibrio aeruginosavorus]